MKGYAYRIDGADGAMADRVKPGEVIIERQYMGRTHDWNVVNFQTGEDKGGFTGTFLCQVELANDRLTPESRRRVNQLRSSAPAQNEG